MRTRCCVWLSKYGSLLSDRVAGDDAEERLASTTGSAVPASLSFVLARHNGGFGFEMRLLSVEEILAAVGNSRVHFQSRQPRGDLLAVLETGEVVEWDIDEKTAGETLASTSTISSRTTATSCWPGVTNLSKVGGECAPALPAHPSLDGPPISSPPPVDHTDVGCVETDSTQEARGK